ncbi:murein hydrolase activator EnvC family protein [Sedimentitalea nanhaiensis]|uniref:Septal ring factor EnvC, activator of murein hydrolases AmiA and AmiB n=1 Tax=Sedimentitalea nanhaiensis TaxID=999627 RepID=A0A1I6YUR4_9RHOB|nr:peptidoglycan DD-metalloendopeptidase family protein [Sedimentitalea nanhaiensis]SFT54028.1 Septal ring factor EnvC, activator of murein hydrolases AmiA and AmiB [Sedimentitalea nanhaiensis]
MITRSALIAAVMWAESAIAQSDPASAARAAVAQLEQATVSLQQAESARDRVRALTGTIQAYEAGLVAMRDGLRKAATREAQLSRQLQAREGEISRLLGVLQTIGTASPPVLLLHPAGALGSARSGMILAEVTPALQGRADQLRSDLQEVQTLRMLQKNAASTLQEGLAGVQQARADLSKAVANRTDLPRRFTEDPVRTAILISSVETLDGFASGLSQISGSPIPPSDAEIDEQKGEVALPVQGLLLHRAGEADAAGVVRSGILVATRPRALVTAPTAATIRYRGPLLDLGNVVILEPQRDTLFVLSGLAEVFGDTGQVVPAGAPVGLMGGEIPEIGAILSLSGDGAGAERSETLYIEVREDGRPVDPETWFRTDKDG